VGAWGSTGSSVGAQAKEVAAWANSRLPCLHNQADLCSCLEKLAGFIRDSIDCEVLSRHHRQSSVPIPTPAASGAFPRDIFPVSDSQVHFYISYSCSRTGPAPINAWSL